MRPPAVAAAYAGHVDRPPTERTDTTRGEAARDLAPDTSAEPEGYLVAADDGTRLHFLDWGEPAAALSGLPGVLLLHGIGQTAWVWAPVGRRLAGSMRVVAADLRGHGLSDAPTHGYDATTLALDATAVADAAGLLPGHVVVAGHGFGAIVGATVAARLGPSCSGLVLVDGGWEAVDPDAGLTSDEWLRSIEEPPEVLASMSAYLADRLAFDPSTWDVDQERAARAAVVELPAGRVVLVTRRHVLEGIGETLLAYDPLATLRAVSAPVVALAAHDDADGTRAAALARASAAVLAAGRLGIRAVAFPADGHNLMRYRPEAVAGAVLALARAAARGDA